MIDVPHLYRPLINHHLIHMSVGEEFQESNIGNQDIYKDVSDILQDMLTKYHIHEDVEVDYAKGDGGVVNTHDHIKTLCEDMISKDESLLLVYVLFSKGTQYINDMTPHNDKVFDPIGFDIEQVVTLLPINTKIYAKEHGIFCDAKIVAILEPSN